MATIMKKKSIAVNDNQVLLEPSKYPSLKANLEAYGVNYDAFTKDVDAKYQKHITKFQNSSFPTDAWSSNNKISKDIVKQMDQLNELLKKQDPTKIPFWGTVLGAWLVNPCPISQATLQRMALNEIVSKCISTNVSKLVNNSGDYYNDDDKCQDIIRRNLHEEQGYFATYIEQMYSAPSIFGHSVNYIRDYVNDDGETCISNLDLLPPSTILYSGSASGDIANIYQYVYAYPLANTQNLYSIPYFGLDASNNDFGSTDGFASYGDLIFPYRTTVLNTFGLVRLDMEKCIHFTGDDLIKTANPYGWSPLCRRVFDLVILYDLFKNLYTSFLGNRSVPIVVGYADPAGTVDLPDGTTIKAIEGLYNAFENQPKFGAILLSGQKDKIYTIDVVQSTGDADSFFKGVEWSRKQIQQTMGMPDNMYESNASYAGATAQGSVFGDTISASSSRIEHKMLRSYVKFLLDKNIPNYKNLGRFDRGLSNLDDIGKFVKIAHELVDAQIINPQQKIYVDYINKAIKYPQLTDAEFKEHLKIIKEANEMGGPGGLTKSKDNSTKTNVQESSKHYEKSDPTNQGGTKK